MDLVTAIEKRRSVRQYDKKPVPRQLVRQVVVAGQNAVPLYPEIGVRWYTVWDGALIARQLASHTTGYGLFATIPHCIIAVSEERPGYMENLGFRMEQLVLTATNLGLGTCWIGGMFDKDSLTEYTPDLDQDECIVALTPLGYQDTSQGAHMARRLHRWGTDYLGTRKKLPEIASQYTWAIPWTEEEEAVNQILDRVRLAPSWANTQPWHFLIDDRQIIATVDHTPQQDNVREGKPYYRLDGGIAMCHLYLAAKAAGWPGLWRIPEAAESKMLRDRYAIPTTHDILGVFPRMPAGRNQ